ncbi:nickel-binding protein [Catalinimonas niigatensis]|uniref:nickel-binding protein n=1 Tax=Catalinimonas niigatensis TaxID=1397264 RepID=UPI002665D39D|nr:nickel-binding protein [Catalinimonas niigatensis]WPP50742.1 DUF4242 domain-containing protein [Catalinimonas niigatensis]
MPLYIDFHKLNFLPTEEELRKGHELDLEVQEEYRVRFQQFWFNKNSSTVFCLIEAPNAEAIMHCHWAGTGDTPCNIQEVEPLYLRLFMGEPGALKHDLTFTIDGKVDPANRTLLLIMLSDAVPTKGNATLRLRFTPPLQLKEMIIDILSRFKGRFVEQSTQNSLVGVFDSPVNTLSCAEDLKDFFKRYAKENDLDLGFRMALHSGQPLTNEGGFFEEAIKQTKRLCIISQPQQIIVSSYLKNQLETETEATMLASSPSTIKVLSEPEEEFLHHLFESIEQNLSQESFNVNMLSTLIGISRPQLYRKTTSLTGRSPNHFIKDLRMQKALSLLKSRKGNISEIAMEVGYSNPSYFSKLFYESFGHTPSSMNATS